MFSTRQNTILVAETPNQNGWRYSRDPAMLNFSI
jgi:hypothetical protein